MSIMRRGGRWTEYRVWFGFECFWNQVFCDATDSSSGYFNLTIRLEMNGERSMKKLALYVFLYLSALAVYVTLDLQVGNNFLSLIALAIILFGGVELIRRKTK